MIRSVKLASKAIGIGDRAIRLRQSSKFTPGPWALQDLPKLIEANLYNSVLATNAPELLGMAKKTRTICRELMDGSAITDEQKTLLHRHWVELSLVIDNAEGRQINEQVEI